MWFHAAVIVGWGELDAKFVTDKSVKFITGKDGEKKSCHFGYVEIVGRSVAYR